MIPMAVSGLTASLGLEVGEMGKNETVLVTGTICMRITLTHSLTRALARNCIDVVV